MVVNTSKASTKNSMLVASLVASIVAFFMLFISPSFASELINLSIATSSETPNDTANYTLQYHLAQPVESEGAVVDIEFPAGYLLPTQCGVDVTLNIDGKAADCNALTLESDVANHIRIRPDDAMSSGTQIMLILDSVQNTPTAGRYYFRRFQTTNSAGEVLDQAQPTPALGVNIPPEISGAPLTRINELSLYRFSPAASDEEGHPLTFFMNRHPSWMSIEPNTGEVFGVPQNKDVGVFTGVEIGVTDGFDSVTLPPFNVLVFNINQPPKISGTPPPSVDQNSPYQFLPEAFDPDGDTLSFSVENLPVWAQFDSATGELSGTPTLKDAGEFSNIIISASDGRLSTALPAFSIEVTRINDVPIIRGEPAPSVLQGAQYTFVPEVIDDDISLLFTIENLPLWMQFDETNGILQGSPTNDDVGVYQGIVISVTDGFETASLPVFSIEVVNVNDAPEISGMPATSVEELQSYAFLPRATDIDNDNLIFAVQGLPPWASFDALTGALTGTPDIHSQGVYRNIIVSVSDGIETVSLPAFSIEVINVNQPPTIEGSDFALVAGSILPITPQISDPDEDALQVELVQAPQLGELFLDGDVWLYQAPMNMTGRDSFSLLVSDGQLASPVALFNVDILPVEALVSSDIIVAPENPENVYILDVLENDMANTDEVLTLVASFSIFGDAFVEQDLIRLVLNQDRPNYITLDYIVENASGQQAVAQAVLVIQN